ncbi:Putative dihydroxyacetone kinase, ADP-binding subunit [hydrothermal vent metagenome]|uniref:Dihydroxyacetone kinase, ADP-binding subunit n=1 Tax=hydrothermal vent metagenome TaxID=652676 RepID=A0A3B1BRL5_9ZZZZ
MATFSTRNIRVAASMIANHMEKAADDLNAADGRLGDGDLGITVSRGWREITNAADKFPSDVGMSFLECAKCFQRVSPSSFGTLMASAFMSAAKQCKGHTVISYADISLILDGACAAMMSRGKGKLGDKSVLDVIHAMAVATKGQQTPNDVLKACQKAVKETLNEFENKQNRLGRARMFGEKSIGLNDPGMLAVQQMIKGLSGVD